MIEVVELRSGFYMRLHLAAEGSAVETDFTEIHQCRKLNRMLLVCCSSIPFHQYALNKAMNLLPTRKGGL
jgi:hypothetical protein